MSRLLWMGFALGCNGDGPKSPAGTGDSAESPDDTGMVTQTTSPRPTTGDTGDALGPRYADGDRLIARTIGAAGSDDRVFAYFEDTELGVACSFRLATDEVLRCLPIPDTRVVDSAFADADCTEPVAAYACGDAPYRLQGMPLPREDACDPRRTVYEVREVEPVASPEGLFVSDGGCVPLTDDTALVAGREGPVVDPEAFVAAVVEERSTQQGIGVREIVAEDGARRRLELFTTTDGTCALRYLDGLGPRCVPRETAMVGLGPGVSWWWSSATCDETPLAYTPRDECDEELPRVAIEFATSGSPVLHRVGESWTETLAWDGASGDCVERTVAETPWTLLPVLGPGGEFTLPPLTVDATEGDPVGFTWFVDEFGLRVAPGFDEGRLGYTAGGPFRNDEGVGCSGVLTADGSARCLDGDGWSIGDDTVRYYTDDACTQEVLQVSGEAPARVSLTSRDVCGVAVGAFGSITRDIVEVDAAVGGTELYFREPGGAGCQASARDPGLTYHPLGASVLDELPALTVE